MATDAIEQDLENGILAIGEEIVYKTIVCVPLGGGEMLVTGELPRGAINIEIIGD